MYKDAIKVQPQEKADAAQAKAIRDEVGCGMMQARKLAKKLNEEGVLTWQDVYKSGGCYI